MATKDAKLLRKAAAQMRAYGFSPLFGSPGGCGCFLHAFEEAGVGAGRGYNLYEKWLLPVVGAGFGADELNAAGWTYGCTEDAAAAIEIAADLADRP